MMYHSLQEAILVGFIFYSPVIIAFVIGTVIGSLTNVIIHRIVYYKSIWSPPSHCTSCGTEIPGYLNIPLVSYLALRGKCRFCGARFTSRYFWVELISGILYALVVLWIYTLPQGQGLGLSWGEVLTYRFRSAPPLAWPSHPATMLLLLKGFIFSSFLLVLIMVDLEHQLLPDRITIPGIIIGLVLGLVAPLDRQHLVSLGTTGVWDAYLQTILGLVVGGGILYLIAVIVPAGMGGGDIKLMAMIGAFVGIKALGPAMFSGFVIGGVIAVVLMILGKAKRRSLIPFGPFLAMGGLIGFYWGSDIWVMYMHHVFP
jgi:leader peptidase (prepilin peptidase)/N-methyltransferase